jgi:hypothetical protein
LPRIGHTLLLSVALTACFAASSQAQDTPKTGTPQTPATTPAQNPPAQTPATDPATPPATPADPPQVTNTPMQTPTSPLSLHVGDSDLTIGGFMDATLVTRSVNTGTGLGTSFGTIPFSNTPQGSLSETRLSAQNSRITLTATSKYKDLGVKGYLEADFLGAGPTNQFVTSNSATLRMRLYWVQAMSGKYEFLAGQTWSLITPGRNGISPNPGDLFYSQDVDTNYQLGLTWTRALEFRFAYHPSKTISAAAALENPQQYVGSATTLPAAFPAAVVDQGANTATPNLYPDIILKAAFDPQTGKLHQHFDIAGLIRGFKTADANGQNKDTATGTGIAVTGNVEPIHNLHIIGTGFWSNGGGRYIGNTNIPDFIVNADNTISTVKSRSWIFGVEDQMLSKTLVDLYYSQAHADAQTAIDTNGKTIGYGFNPQPAANQKLSEFSFGVTQVFFRDPKIGGLQVMFEYSYLTRTPFAVAAGSPTSAHANMVFFNIRYILP